ncbi:MAG TPA: hypothetical protein PK821_07030 [Victivallales bacterium]|nr:hypothetical protein [Victivallales bacterium]
MKSRIKSSCFTIIELLVVIAIMALLLYAAMPAFEKMAKGSGVELAARNVYNYLSMARNYAITNRQYIAVVFPMTDETLNASLDYPNSGVPATHRNRGYRACIVNSSKVFQRWIPGDSWQLVPAGVAFLDVGNDSDDDPVVDSGERNDAIVAADALIADVNFSDLTGGSSMIDDVVAIIFKPTGRIVGAERFVEMGEGVFNTDTLVVTNRTAGAFATIKVDEYTGRVSYGKD